MQEVPCLKLASSTEFTAEIIKDVPWLWFEHILVLSVGGAVEHPIPLCKTKDVNCILYKSEGSLNSVPVNDWKFRANGVIETQVLVCFCVSWNY
jgi:hypothetical protein